MKNPSLKFNTCIEGIVFSGKGEGKSYVVLYRDVIRKYLGFDPYPGTLNILIDDVSSINKIFGSIQLVYVVPPPTPKLHAVLVRAIILKHKNRDFLVYALRPLIDQYYSNAVELIAPINLRQRLGLEDGDSVELCF